MTQDRLDFLVAYEEPRQTPKKKTMMHLYFAPGACSLAPHIALEALGLKHELHHVDMKTKMIKTGKNLMEINPKSQVPVLQTQDGTILTECAVILQYLADQVPDQKLLPPVGSLERYKAQEWLNYVAAELHKGLGFLFMANHLHKDNQASEELRNNWIQSLGKKFEYLSRKLSEQPFLLGSQFSAVDAYAFTILNWHQMLKIDLTKWPSLMGYMERVKSQPAVQRALKAEGLI